MNGILQRRSFSLKQEPSIRVQRHQYQTAGEDLESRAPTLGTYAATGYFIGIPVNENYGCVCVWVRTIVLEKNLATYSSPKSSTRPPNIRKLQKLLRTSTSQQQH